MTLATMRANGVRSLAVTCNLCHHAALLNVDRFADAITVPAFRARKSAVTPRPPGIPAL
jgi:hypothetical protein